MKLRLTNGDIIDFDERTDKILSNHLFTRDFDEDGVVIYRFVGEIIEVLEL